MQVALKTKTFIPLSYPQMQLWYVCQNNPKSPLYNDAFLIRMNHFVDIEALEYGFSELVKRNEILRTTFKMDSDMPIQLVHPPYLFKLETLDLYELPTEEQKYRFETVTTRFMRKPFITSKLPLIRGMLLAFNDKDYRLLCVNHHMIMDGISVYQVLVPDLERLYSSYRQKSCKQVFKRRLQYKDFALWQREHLTDEFLAPSIHYWKNKLRALPPTKLFENNYNSGDTSIVGKRRCFKIPSNLLHELKMLSRQENTSLFMTFVTVVNTLMHRYTGRLDIILGTITSGRVQPEMESIIGTFINPIVLRTKLQGRETFKELLSLMCKEASESYSNQIVPFGKIVSVINPDRKDNENPIFQVPVVFQPQRAESRLGWKTSFLETHAGIAKFDLSFTFDEMDDGIIAAIEYKTSLFDDLAINRMISHFQILLQGVVENPDQKISWIPMLTNDEQKTIINQWCGTDICYDRLTGLHRLFEEQVKKSPKAKAVILDEEFYSYERLNNKANQLANLLRSKDIRPNDIVGIHMERSLDIVVAMLGVLKSGAAYMPIEPEYPKERIMFMIEDSGAKLILSHSKHLMELFEFGEKVICMDDVELLTDKDNGNTENDLTGPGNAAYVIYTSGTTGKPKGVVIPHQAICNHMKWMLSEFNFTENDSVLQKTSHCFDASVWEFYAPLLCGGKLVLAHPGAQKDVVEIVRLLTEYDITVLQGVPTFLRMLTENMILQAVNSLRIIFSGGEPLSVKLEQKILNKLNVELVNLYGPTEACIDATFWRCQKGLSHKSVPIGKPVANCKAYILDKNLQPMPVGCAGELHIGGIQLAEKYLNRPKLTKKKFISDPFSGGKKRMYKTGDIVRWRSDGIIEYIGRFDDQVKVHGYRVELSEIEQTLTTHPMVAQAAVKIWEDEQNNKQIAAYVVVDNNDITDDAIKAYLLKRIPEYMVPRLICKLEKMPITANGKVNRKALPKVRRTETLVKSSYVEPETATQKILAGIWKKYLKVEKVGIHDNFFRMGGDSIMTMMIQSAAAQEGIRLSARQLIENQTIAEQSKIAEKDNSKSEIDQIKKDCWFTLSSSQKYVLDVTKPYPNHFAMSSWFEVPTGLSIHQITTILNRMAQHHDNLSLRFRKTGDHWFCWEQRYIEKEAAKVPLDLKDFSRLTVVEIETARKELIVSQSECLDIINGPIMKGTLCQMGSGKRSLLLTIHYIAADAMSWRILEEDFNIACKQLIKGKEIKFSEKTAPFSKWVEKSTTYAETLDVEKWIESNRSWDNTLRLKTDFSNKISDNKLETVKEVIADLDPRDTDKLLTLVPKVFDCKILEALLAGITMALCQCNDCKEIVIDVESHGREADFSDIDLSRTVGLFTIVFPVLFKTEANIIETLISTKRILRKVKGMDFSLIRFLSRPPQTRLQFDRYQQTEISYNYMGQYEQNMIGFSRYKGQNRKHLLEINGSVSNGRMQMGWLYSSNIFKRATIDRMAQAYMDNLRELVCVVG